MAALFSHRVTSCSGTQAKETGFNLFGSNFCYFLTEKTAQ